MKTMAKMCIKEVNGPEMAQEATFIVNQQLIGNVWLSWGSLPSCAV